MRDVFSDYNKVTKESDKTEVTTQKDEMFTVIEEDQEKDTNETNQPECTSKQTNIFKLSDDDVTRVAAALAKMLEEQPKTHTDTQVEKGETE